MSAWENEWNINATELLMGNPDYSVIKIVQQGSGNSRHFTIESESGEASDCWRGCCLAPRGKKPFIYSGRPLDPWVPGDDDLAEEYALTIRKQLQRTDANTNRLEGEFEIEGVLHWIKLFLCRQAVVNPAGGLKDLLIIRYSDKFPWTARAAGLGRMGDEGGGAGGIEDGTGHGNKS
ncbi:MAG TPA: hypothetical protein VFU13_11490 [Steroidobacteraceae bacterium]|nr:hypothetical protein [Steroidobacteraceae bacterium]